MTEIIELPNTVYRYRPAKCREIDALIEGHVWLSCPTSFDDPWDCALSPQGQTLSVAAKREIKMLRVACFTRRDDNTRMWTHYANCHRGICVGYRTNGVSLNESNLREVTYSNDCITYLDHLSYGDPSAFELFTRLVTTKSLDWKDQEELRFVSHVSSGNILDIDRDDLVSITFGLRCKRSIKMKLLNTLGLWGHVDFREVTMDSSSMLPMVRLCNEQHGDPNPPT